MSKSKKAPQRPSLRAPIAGRHITAVIVDDPAKKPTKAIAAPASAPGGTHMRPSKALLRSLEQLRKQGVPFVRIKDLKPWADNPRHNAEAVPVVVRSMQRFGWTNPILARAKDGFVEAGHTRLTAAVHLGLTEVPRIRLEHSEADAKLYAIADNRTAEHSRWNEEALFAFLRSRDKQDILDAGWADPDGFLASLPQGSNDNSGAAAAARATLAERFGVPPFSVLDARQGYWMERKRSWVALGIQSEIGRAKNLLKMSPQTLEALGTGKDYAQVAEEHRQRKAANAVASFRDQDKLAAIAGEGASTGTSIFDPVLTELLVRWFSPPGGFVLDPFAGGSVRGIVAGTLGRHYAGIDLRLEQVEANAQQWERIGARSSPAYGERDFEVDGIRIHSDHLVPGGTKQIVLERLLHGPWAGEEALVYASPAYGFAQVALAHACASAGKKCVIFVAKRDELHPATAAAKAAGAAIVEVPHGYMSHVTAKAQAFAAETKAMLVPMGIDCQEFIEELAAYAREAVPQAPREVWCVAGSGVLARALRKAFPRAAMNAVAIGKQPELPKGCALRRAPEKFERDAAEPPPFPSNPNYDAKAWRFIRQHASKGALFWNVAGPAGARPQQGTGSATWLCGDSRKLLPNMVEQADFILSCPPYGDLEQYSDDPADLSNMSWEEFCEAYGEIVAASVARLKENRFAAFVVGDLRDAQGLYRNFVSLTIAAFERAGARLYNEAILVTSIGTLPIRAGKIFEASKKLGKTHQNVLVFVKGDPRKASDAVGPIEFGEVGAMVEAEALPQAEAAQ